MHWSFGMLSLYPKSCKHQHFLSFVEIPAWPPNLFSIFGSTLCGVIISRREGPARRPHFAASLDFYRRIQDSDASVVRCPSWNRAQIRVFECHVISMCFCPACNHADHADDREHWGGDARRWRGISFPPIRRSGVAHFFFSSVEYCTDRRPAPI